MTSSLPVSFLYKKSRILEQLSVPVPEYDDLSPKGSIDVGIRKLMDEINGLQGCVTTSSCAGRISVFLEGNKTLAIQGNGEGDAESEVNGNQMKAAGVGGKGGGGRWLFVSHDPVEVGNCEGKGDLAEMMGMSRSMAGEDGLETAMGKVIERRLIHFKFEPMILHILTASLKQAQSVLSAALQAGFRESGALNLISSSSEPPSPMVGIRSMGLALESVIGFESGGKEICMVPDWQLKNLVEISNQRFIENTKRIVRFRTLLKDMSGEGVKGGKKKGQEGEVWEDGNARRDRKRAEGLKRAKEGKEAKVSKDDFSTAEDVPDVGGRDHNNI